MKIVTTMCNRLKPVCNWFKKYKNTATEYGSISKLFHWVVFLVLVGLVVTAQMLDAMEVGAEGRFEIFKLHASFGFLMLILMILRVSWRWTNVKPTPLSAPKWQINTALTVHILLYVMIIAQAVSGVMRVIFKGFDLPFFGTSIPWAMRKNEEIAGMAKWVHEFIPWVVIPALILHIAAALYHHFKLKDDTLRRMTWGKVSGSGSES